MITGSIFLDQGQRIIVGPKRIISISKRVFIGGIPTISANVAGDRIERHGAHNIGDGNGPIGRIVAAQRGADLGGAATIVVVPIGVGKTGSGSGSMIMEVDGP